MKPGQFAASFFIALLISVSVVWGQSQPFKLPENITPQDYVQGMIIYKLLPVIRTSSENQIKNTDALKQALMDIGAANPQRLFPKHTSPVFSKAAFSSKRTDLSLIYECAYSSDLPIEQAIQKLLATGLVEYAQPRYLVYPMSYVPDDPMNINQYHLTNLRMFAAWDIARGDTNMVVAITDWGVDMNHVDLKNNIKYNYDDPIDGIDNDNDGYVDNYYGWDMGSNDNDPTGVIVHGTYVSGCSSASTDNGAGVSGTGFLCKFLPIKIADNNNMGTRGYESIVYAADHGAKVINCSWGSPFYIGPYGQDIVNYATFNQGALVLAAAGNDNSQSNYYPASYDYVVNVAGTNSTDGKWISSPTSGSSYGFMIDLCAPGDAVWTTSPGGTYNSSGGTSLASPLAAGCAALLWSYYPSYTPLQVAAKLKASCDVIDTLTANLAYAGLMGAGRINMYRALTDTLLPYVELLDPLFTDADQDAIFEKGDTIYLSGDFFNFLAPTSAAFKASLSSISPYVILIDSVFNGGVIQNMQSVSNTANPFAFKIGTTTPPSQTITLRIDYTDTSFTSFQYLTITVNSDYVTVDTNKVAMTITSNGALGYNRGNSLQGVGFTYNNGVSLLSSGGFLAGVSSVQVSDAILGFTGALDQDFESLANVQKVSNPLRADFETIGVFDDTPAGINKLNIQVNHHALAWDREGRSKFVIMEMAIVNMGSGSLNDLYVGCYMDWDVQNAAENTASWDAARKMGYVFPYNGGQHVGMMILQPSDVFHYAFDMDGANVSINLEDGFSGFEKYYALRTSRNQAGNFFPGNDVADMMSAGPFYLAPMDTAKVTYAFLAGDFLTDLQTVADSAIAAYQQLTAIERISDPDIDVQISPNPGSDQIRLDFNIPSADVVEISVLNMLGDEIVQPIVNNFSAGPHSFYIPCKSWPSGVYFVRFRTQNQQVLKKMLKF